MLLNLLKVKVNTTLTKRNKNIVSHIINTLKRDRVFCIKKDTKIRFSFWWEIIHCSTYVRNWRSYMPRCLGNIKKLLPEFYNIDEETKLNYPSIDDIPEKEILFLAKRSKKKRDYIKPEELTDCAEFLKYVLSSSKIKYVFFGKIDSFIKKERRDNRQYVTSGQNVFKIYPKEVEAFEKAGLKLVNPKCMFTAQYKNEVRFMQGFEYLDYDFHKILNFSGYLFEIPKISKKEKNFIFKKIANQRFKELHIDFSI